MQENTYHDQAEAIIPASQPEVFAYMDDQTHLAAHMGKPSMLLLGGQMSFEMDVAQGRAVRSVIRMGGVSWG